MPAPVTLRMVVERALRFGGAKEGYVVEEADPGVVVLYPKDPPPPPPIPAVSPYAQGDNGVWGPVQRPDSRLERCREILGSGFSVREVKHQGRDALHVTELAVDHPSR